MDLFPEHPNLPEHPDHQRLLRQRALGDGEVARIAQLMLEATQQHTQRRHEMTQFAGNVVLPQMA